MKPLLSICCTSFNHGKYLKDTLEGFLAQKTNFPIEIIVHDDASTDSSVEIIKEFAAKDDRIITILQTENQYSQNIKPWANFVFPRAQGKYIALCEGDDYWIDPLKLQKQVDFLESNQDYAICFHDAKIFDETTKEMKSDTITNSEKENYNLDDLVNGNFMHTPTVVLRNDFILPHDFSMLPIGDWPLYMIMIKERKIKKFNQEMAVYRLHSNSSWSSKSMTYRLQKSIITVKYLLKVVPLNKSQKKGLKQTLKIYKKKLFKIKFKFFK